MRLFSPDAVQMALELVGDPTALPNLAVPKKAGTHVRNMSFMAQRRPYSKISFGFCVCLSQEQKGNYHMVRHHS